MNFCSPNSKFCTARVNKNKQTINNATWVYLIANLVSEICYKLIVYRRLLTSDWKIVLLSWANDVLCIKSSKMARTKDEANADECYVKNHDIRKPTFEGLK